MLRVLLPESFRVKLDRQEVWEHVRVLKSQFQSLNNTISTNGSRTQNFSQTSHRLMMGTIDAQGLHPANGRDHGTLK